MINLMPTLSHWSLQPYLIFPDLYFLDLISSSSDNPTKSNQKNPLHSISSLKTVIASTLLAMNLLERALSDLIGLAIKSKAWSVVTSVGIPSSVLGIWQSDNRELCCSCDTNRGGFHPMCMDSLIFTCTKCVQSFGWWPLFFHQFGVGKPWT